jgi:hypothetical protein
MIEMVFTRIAPMALCLIAATNFSVMTASMSFEG